jgi:hypothetical protein
LEDGNLYLGLQKMSHISYAANGKVSHIRSDIEEFEVAKGVIRIHISKMNRQDNAKQKGQKDNNDLQNIYIKLKIKFNMTFFFRFVNKRVSYPFGIISLAHVEISCVNPHILVGFVLIKK